ncbi:hypothetical protein I8748_18115 [Nostoc sp. CENA67]|uniref:Uncharacterized protein n=1 Tax=Amazonocrinis nigriterrae CENA67 TaxID=2794033 RepID=A0A8J7HVI8_9NOST|nr:DUF6334 family protein [Amazonocrinis nigriterrae]MBH8564077.1 hypothetical protein [Amazonocrinis nigriterrae CENA67]
MAINEFPIGQVLIDVSTIEDQEFDGNELCLNEVKLYFKDEENRITLVTLLPVIDTDEIEVTIEVIRDKTQVHGSNVGNHHLQSLLARGAKMMSVWVCENTQGYQDQVIFAFQNLHPTITFLAEGSVIKVFVHEQVHKKIDKSAKLNEANNNAQINSASMGLYETTETSVNESKIMK